MKKLLLLLLFPLMMFAQDTTLTGDVDCSGEVNSEDASLILQFVTSIIDELPCQENMTGLTPEQLQEIITLMDAQLNVNYGGSGIDILYPDGSGGESITWDLVESYIVPSGKTLYITNYHSDVSTSYYLSINDIDVYRGYSNWDAYGGSHQPFVINSGEVVSASNEVGSFNGILMNTSIDVVGITWNLTENYTVPSGKTLYITNYHSDVSTSYYLSINDIEVYRGYSNWDAYGGSDQPFIVNSGEVVSANNAVGSFNGYLVDEDYFSSAGSGSNAAEPETIDSGSISTREYSFEFNALLDNDTLYVSELIGQSINQLSVEIIDVDWSSELDQDVLVDLVSDASSTKNYGQIEIRGDFNGNTLNQGYPRSPVSSGSKAMKKLNISANNPYFVFSPYSYNGTGGTGVITFWITANFEL